MQVEYEKSRFSLFSCVSLAFFIVSCYRRSIMPNPEMRMSPQSMEPAKEGGEDPRPEQKPVVNLSPEKVFGLYKYVLDKKSLDEVIEPILHKIRDEQSLIDAEQKIVNDYALLRRTRKTVVEWLKERRGSDVSHEHQKEYKTFAKNIEHLREEQELASQDYGDIESGLIHRVESALTKNASAERQHRWETKWYVDMDRIFSQLKEKYTERGIEDLGEQVVLFLQRIERAEKIRFPFDIKLHVHYLIAARTKEAKEVKAMKRRGERKTELHPTGTSLHDPELDDIIALLEGKTEERASGSLRNTAKFLAPNFMKASDTEQTPALGEKEDASNMLGKIKFLIKKYESLAPNQKLVVNGLKSLTRSALEDSTVLDRVKKQSLAVGLDLDKIDQNTMRNLSSAA